MAEKYTGIEKYIFSDIYNFFLKYKDIPNSDYHWNRCINDAKLIEIKYNGYPFVKRMLVDTMNQLEFKACNKLVDGATYEQWDRIAGNYKETKQFSPTSHNYSL